jgi:hypothetical protein
MMTDAYDNGICCEYRNGGYEFYYDDGELVNNGGIFNSYESTTFGAPCGSYIHNLEGKTLFILVFLVTLRIWTGARQNSTLIPGMIL